MPPCESFRVRAYRPKVSASASRSGNCWYPALRILARGKSNSRTSRKVRPSVRQGRDRATEGRRACHLEAPSGASTPRPAAPETRRYNVVKPPTSADIAETGENRGGGRWPGRGRRRG